MLVGWFIRRLFSDAVLSAVVVIEYDEKEIKTPNYKNHGLNGGLIKTWTAYVSNRIQNRMIRTAPFWDDNFPWTSRTLFFNQIPKNYDIKIYFHVYLFTFCWVV